MADHKMKSSLLMLRKWLIYRVVWPLVARLPYRLGYKVAKKLDNRFRKQPQYLEQVKAGMRAFSDAAHCHLDPDQAIEPYLDMHARERLDTYRLSHLKASDFQKQVALTGEEAVGQALREKKGAILIMAHYGRPVMLCSALAHRGFKIGMLTGSVKENPNLDPVDLWFHYFGMENTLLHSKGSWFTTAEPLRGLYRALEEGQIIIIMMDLPAQDNGVKVPFLDGELNLPPGIIRIAQKTQAGLLFGSARESDHGKVNAKLYRLDDEPEIALQQAAAHLEQEVRSAPSQWWQWNHWPAIFKKDTSTKK